MPELSDQDMNSNKFSPSKTNGTMLIGKYAGFILNDVPMTIQTTEINSQGGDDSDLCSPWYLKLKYKSS